jgi:hypothetical protein
MKMKIIKEGRPVPRKTNRALLITGDGKTYPDDLKCFLRYRTCHDAMCIGRSIQLYPFKVEHYADVDADAGKWVLENIMNNHPDKGNPITHTLGDVEWVDAGWDLEASPWPSEEVMWHGSTALFAVLIGIAMGYPRIVLAGCPLDSKGHWYFPDETYGPKWTGETYQAWFEFAETPEAGRVKSMSGYTKQLLGGYTGI